MKDKKEILDDLIAYAKSRGYNEYAYSLGVISTYLTEKDLVDLEKFVKRCRVDDGMSS